MPTNPAPVPEATVAGPAAVSEYTVAKGEYLRHYRPKL